MKQADIISATIITVFGLLVIFVIIPIWVPGHDDGSYGLRAQDFPYVVAATFTLLAGILLVRRLFFTPSEAEEVASPLDRETWKFLVIALAVMLVTFFLLKTIGILGGGPVLVGAFMYMMGERRPIPIIALSLGAPITVWLFFWKLLRFPLP